MIKFQKYFAKTFYFSILDYMYQYVCVCVKISLLAKKK